jgi:hypothetical protein
LNHAANIAQRVVGLMDFGLMTVRSGSARAMLTSCFELPHRRVLSVQESLPELIGVFDGAMNEVSRRSMDLASMKELSRAALNEEHSAVGDLEEHLKCVSVSMRSHLNQIFVEVNRWPGHVQRLLTHKQTKGDIGNLDTHSLDKTDSLSDFLLTAGEHQQLASLSIDVVLVLVS